MKKIKKFLFSEIDSTNEYAKQLSRTETGDVMVIASRQTAGKGRLGRTFHSPDGGIYMSLLLHPTLPTEKISLITVMASVAMRRTIESVCQKEALIKWVNDIYLDGKKVCGILTEGSFDAENNKFKYIILGVGINVFEPTDGFPDELKNIATSIFPTKIDGIKDSIISVFTDNFFSIYENYENTDYLNEYREKNIVLGKDIEYIKDNELHKATATGIDGFANLTVIENGKKISLNAGEVKIVTDSIFNSKK